MGNAIVNSHADNPNKLQVVLTSLGRNNTQLNDGVKVVGLTLDITVESINGTLDTRIRQVQKFLNDNTDAIGEVYDAAVARARANGLNEIAQLQAGRQAVTTYFGRANTFVSIVSNIAEIGVAALDRKVLVIDGNGVRIDLDSPAGAEFLLADVAPKIIGAAVTSAATYAIVVGSATLGPIGLFTALAGIVAVNTVVFLAENYYEDNYKQDVEAMARNAYHALRDDPEIVVYGRPPGPPVRYVLADPALLADPGFKAAMNGQGTHPAFDQIKAYNQGQGTIPNYPGLTAVTFDPTSSTATIVINQNGETLIGKLTADQLADFNAGSVTNLAALRDAVDFQTVTTVRAGDYVIGDYVGSSFGSVLGRYLAGEDKIGQVVLSSVLGTVGQNIGQAIAVGGLTRPFVRSDQAVVKNQVNGVIGNFSSELLQQFQANAVGAISSALALELGNVLGVKGFGGELLTTAASSVFSQLANNAINLATQSGPAFTSGQNLFYGLDGKGLFGSVDKSGVSSGGLLAGAVGSFLGAKLGSLILAPNNTEGAILSSIGASAGVWALTSGASALGIGTFTASLGKIFGSLANIGVPFVGSLVGFLLGSLIGRLFGSKKPRTPTASAETMLNLTSGYWELGTISSANNGNRNLVTNMATTSKDGINAILGYLVGGVDTIVVSNTAQPRQKYGHTGSTLYYDEYNGSGWVRRYSGANADQAVEMGVLSGLQTTKVAGGDLLRKRALYGTVHDDAAALLGAMQIAEDYGRYLLNPQPINALIQAEPDSAFASSWIITLLRAEELGINNFRPSDFFGGLRGFTTSFGYGEPGAGFETLALAFEGSALRISATDGRDAFGLLAGFNNVTDPALSSRSVYIADFGANVGYTPWAGEATAGNDIWIASAGGSVTMDDTGTQWVGYWDPYYGYYQYPVTVTGGDDIFVGSSYADALYGRDGWDWLDGGAGNDLIDGGGQNDVLLGREGSDRMLGGDGSDYIAGGDGDDYFFDANQTWGLYGGEGNDVLVGGAGSDSPYGEGGDDTIIADQDGGYTWDAINGQAGLDTISYERFTSGVYIDFNVLGGWAWDPTAKYIYGDSVSGVENITGSRYDDVIIGDAIGNVIRGLAGNDSLYGSGGDDRLDGGLGADYLNGGDGVDIVSYAGATQEVVVDLDQSRGFGGEASGDQYVNVEGAMGSGYDDLLKGNAGDNQLSGGGGNDRLVLSDGNDILDGGSGFDVIDASGSQSALTVYDDPGYYDPYFGYYPGAGFIASTASGSMSLSSIEGFIGTQYADYISGTSADETFEGGEGNDTLYGGIGSDTYIFGLADGQDSIADDASGSNTIKLNAGIDWRDVAVSGAYYGQPGGNLVVSIRGTTDQIVVGGNFFYVNGGSNAGNHNHAIKSLDLGGVSAVDISVIDYTPYAADDNATVVYGAQNRADLIFAYAGDDTIYTAGNAYNYEWRGNVVCAGDGNDTIYASYGDDQYVFERGNGADNLFDSGGADTVVMGPSVAADDVIYEVVNTYGSSGDYGSSADLYIGIRDTNNPNAPASQVADRIRIVGGGTKSVGINYGTESLNTIEHVRVGGQEIDLTKANINWTVSYYYDGGYYPVALDLDGDGIELRSVEGSRIATVESDGTVTRMGWLGQDDGFLALDRDGNGVIDRIGEISFIGDKEGAKTDLEGLAAYDSNGDGKLDASDARWSEFKVWQDKNQDGFGSKKELVGLDEAGVSSISLKGQLTGFTAADGPDNTVIATTDVVWKDASRTGSAYDVMLARLQVRTDDAAKGLADLDAKARGKKADDIEAKLRGVQTLTAEQAAAIKEKKSKHVDDGEGGRFYRVEELLEGSSAKVKDGLYSIDPKLAKKAVDVGRKLDFLDRYADSEWTKLGSTQPGEADMRGADAPFKKAELSDAQKAVITNARKIVADRKVADETKAAERAAKDAADAVFRPAPTPPTAKELEKLKKNDKFRLLEGATDASTGVEEKLDPRFLQDDPTDSLARMRILDDGTFVSEEELDDTQDQQQQPSMSVPTRQQLSRVEPMPQDANREGQNAADADAYDVVIRAANARLVQALASFGDAPTMMANYQGLNVANDPQAAWLSVDAMPSVQQLASIR